MSFVGKSSQYYSGFSPQSIPGCVLWLDATDSNTMTLSGSNVTQWNDKSGRGFNFTKNASYPAPAYQTNGINGRPALQFSNNGNLGTTTTTFLENASVSFDNTGYSIFAVANLTAVNSWTNAQYILKGEITGDNYLFFGSRAGNIATFTGPAGSWNDTNANSPTTTILNTPRIVAMTVSNAVMVPYYDGIAMSNKTGTTGSFSGLRLGETAPLGNSGQGWTGFISEVLVYSIALPAAQRQSVEGYLARKWGLTSNIPATQPFRSLPPFSRPFIPVDISGCAVWLDGADSNAMTFSGSNIVQWLDKSGNGRHGSNVGPGNPTLGTTTTGRRTVVMSGTNYFRLSNASTLSVTSASYFVQAYATGSNRSLLSFWNNERILGPTYYWDNATTIGLSPYTWSNTNAVLSIVENSASNCTGHFNGNALTPIAYRAAVANSNVILGAHWSLDVQWLGNIQEVILYDGALTPGQRQQVETYLVNKWGTRGATPAGHYARISPALSLPFSPIFIDGCTMWLDSTDRSAITLTGSNVTGLRDKSPANLTLTGTTGFTWPNNTFNGKYPSFFNVNGGLNGANAASCLGVSTLNLSTPFSVFTVLQKVASAPDGYVMDSGPGGSGRPYTYGSAIITPWASGGFQMSNASVLSMIWTAGNLAAGYHNGTVNFTGSVSLTTGGLTIGNRFSVNESWPGHICEFVIFTGALTTVQRQRMEGYMAWRWGLVGQLPSTHPWKNAMP